MATPSSGSFTTLDASGATGLDGAVTIGDAVADVFTIVPPLMMGEYTDTTGPSTAANQGALFVGSDNSLYYRAESDGATTDLLATGGAPTNATYITQTPNATLTNEQALNALSTGIMQVTTGTGVVSSVTTSAGVAALIGDETGSGALVFGTSPVLGTADINTPDIDGGNIDGTAIGVATPSSGSFTTLDASGATTLNGNVTVGDGGDTITINPSAGTSFSDKNITNVADIALDSISADATSIDVKANLDFDVGVDIADSAGLELLSFIETGSAVNEFTIANAATGNPPVLSATGDDADIDITLTPKGTGEVNISKVDIDSGAIDGTTIGGATPAEGTFTNLTANTTLTAPSGAPTIDAAGEIGVDTTDDQLVYFGTAKRVIPYRRIKCATIESLTTSDTNVPFFNFNKAATVIETSCYTTSTTIPAYDLTNNDGTDLTGEATCVNGATATTWTTVSSGGFTAGETIRFSGVTTSADANSWTTICVAYTENAT